MSKAVFRFKQFSIRHDRCAMKVGTDGVLLGAWAGSGKLRNILDVGTGSGLIALMMAQRFPEAQITALEIDKEAATQAAENADQSPFKDRIRIHAADFFTWNSEKKFDLIVCNPPFYEHSYPAKSSARSVARHGHSFNIPQFQEVASKLLSIDGTLSLIVPENVFDSISAFPDLHLHRICSVFPNPEKKAHRIMAEWRRFSGTIVKERIVLEQTERHQYDPSYMALTKDFYLNF